MIDQRSSTVGLVLSGGGTRGLAHIGAWRILESMGFVPATVVGSSMGAIIGACIAAGKTADAIERFAMSQTMRGLLQWPITRLGITNLTKFERGLMDFIGVEKFEHLRFPLRINATDLVHGSAVVFDLGPIWPAIRASIAFPGILAPVRTQGCVLIDGGALYEHPFTLLPKTVRKFVLINCSPVEHLPAERHSVVDLLRASLNLMQNEITTLRLSAIEPSRYVMIEPRLEGRNLLETNKKFRAIIELGTEAAIEKQIAVRRLIQS